LPAAAGSTRRVFPRLTLRQQRGIELIPATAHPGPPHTNLRRATSRNSESNRKKQVIRHIATVGNTGEPVARRTRQAW
jgi:hypothetical protein